MVELEESDRGKKKVRGGLNGMKWIIGGGSGGSVKLRVMERRKVIY